MKLLLDENLSVRLVALLQAESARISARAAAEGGLALRGKRRH
jgi:predicted nuclease of predicted toxin-antitoxin system